MRFFYKLGVCAFLILLLITTIGIIDINFYEDSSVYGGDISCYESSFPIRSEVEYTHSGMSVTYKYLNVVPLKKIDVELLNTKVYLGGVPIGISYCNSGLIVLGSYGVITEKGTMNGNEETKLIKGDLLVELNGKKICGVGDLFELMMKANGEQMRGKAIRKGKEISFVITPKKDVLTNEYKLGYYVKEGIDGIGTLTYVRGDNLRFGTLGHKVTETETGENLVIEKGSIYPSSIMGFKRGEKGKAGELQGLFIKTNAFGYIDKNTDCGTFGIANEKMLAGMEQIVIAGRGSVKRGRAYIYTTIDGKLPKKYEIEIINLKKQSQPHEKSMVFRVLDKELLNSTGGILQGMSGSPIIQDERLIGAVTHVMLDEPQMGYGLYIDWMINN